MARSGEGTKNYKYQAESEDRKWGDAKEVSTVTDNFRVTDEPMGNVFTEEKSGCGQRQ